MIRTEKFEIILREKLSDIGLTIRLIQQPESFKLCYYNKSTKCWINILKSEIFDVIDRKLNKILYGVCSAS